MEIDNIRESPYSCAIPVLEAIKALDSV